MKRVLFVISSLDTGGAQRALSNIVTNFSDEYEIDILLNDKEHIVYPYRGTILDLGLKIPENRESLVYQLKVFIKRWFVLSKLKKSKKYQACISFLDSANVANILTGKKYCKTIISVRVHLSKSQSSPIYRYIIKPLVKLFYNKADVIVPVAKGVAQDLIDNYGMKPEKIKTIYNGYNLEKIKEAANKENVQCALRRDDDSFYLVTVGRLVHQKAQWHLIRALKQVKEKYPNCKLVILGEGNLENYLKELTVECDLEDNVIFGGYIDNPYAVMEKCDVFVLPSLYEGFPNVLAEAMCCELPCIACDFESGAREILAPQTDVNYQNMSEIEHGEYGILIPVCDETEYDAAAELTKEEIILAQAIMLMMQNEDLRNDYKKKAFVRAQQLSINSAVEQWIDAIQSPL